MTDLEGRVGEIEKQAGIVADELEDGEAAMTAAWIANAAGLLAERLEDSDGDG